MQLEKKACVISDKLLIDRAWCIWIVLTTFQCSRAEPRRDEYRLWWSYTVCLDCCVISIISVCRRPTTRAALCLLCNYCSGCLVRLYADTCLDVWWSVKSTASFEYTHLPMLHNDVPRLLLLSSTDEGKAGMHCVATELKSCCMSSQQIDNKKKKHAMQLMWSQVHVKNLEMLASLALVLCSLSARLERPNRSRGRCMQRQWYILLACR